MIKMIPFDCPKCGAWLEVEESTEYCYCPYCDSKIRVCDIQEPEKIDNREDSHDVYNYNTTNNTYNNVNTKRSAIGDVLDHIERHEESSRREQERLRQKLEREEREKKQAAERRRKEVRHQLCGDEYRIRNLLILGLLIAVTCILGARAAAKKAMYAKIDRTGQAQVKTSATWLDDMDYEDVVLQFETSGFTNIICEPQGDLITGWLTSDGSVESVSINGDTHFLKGDWYPADAKVVIRYHSFPDNNSFTSSSLTVNSSVSLPDTELGDRNGFDTATNFEFEYEGMVFSIPNYYVDDERKYFDKAYYVEGEDKSSLCFRTEDLGGFDTSVASETEREEKAKNIAEERYAILEENSDSDSEFEIMDNIIVTMGNVSYIRTIAVGAQFSMETAFIIAKGSNKAICVVISTDAPSQYSYLEDFERIVNSATCIANKDEQDDSKENEQEDEDVTSVADKIPAIKGTLLEKVAEKATGYGLSKQGDDVDNGDGTISRSYADSGYTLYLDIIFSKETSELVTADIVTTVTASSAEQKKFVETIAEVLCAAEDKANVIEWVNNKIGTKSSTIIGGTEYRLSVGPYGNILFDAGMEAWENWSISNEGT